MDLRIPLPPGVVIQTRSNLPKEQKVSVRLQTLLESLAPDGLQSIPLEKCRTLLDVVVAAWNISVLDKAEWDEKLNEVTTNPRIDRIAQQELKDVLKDIIAIKIGHYPDDQRFIVSWELSYNKNRFSITAAAISRPGQTVI